jgi:hypothetical protein
MRRLIAGLLWNIDGTQTGKKFGEATDRIDVS